MVFANSCDDSRTDSLQLKAPKEIVRRERECVWRHKKKHTHSRSWLWGLFVGTVTRRRWVDLVYLKRTREKKLHRIRISKTELETLPTQHHTIRAFLFACRVQVVLGDLRKGTGGLWKGSTGALMCASEWTLAVAFELHSCLLLAIGHGHVNYCQPFGYWNECVFV